MQHLKLLCVGKIKEAYYRAACAEYEKRLGAFCRFELEELPEQRLSDSPSPGEIAAALEKEAAALRRKIPAGSVLTAFCVEGSAMDSPGFARLLDRWASQGKGSVCFLIGGSHGLSEPLKQQADLRLSVSPMTFPHHLFRVMAMEQLYRAFSILGGSKYHK